MCTRINASSRFSPHFCDYQTISSPSRARLTSTYGLLLLQNSR
nr:MAG TPA: hypothetical protein [Caudoviricetes sp.]